MMMSSSAWLPTMNSKRPTGFEPITIIEAPGAVVVDVNREIEKLRAALPCLPDCPIGQGGRNSAAVMLLQNVDLPILDCSSLVFDRKR